MGMDVYIDGELTIPAAKVPEAGKLLLAATAATSAYDDEEIAEIGVTVFKLVEFLLESIEVEQGDDGSLMFGLEYSCRRYDDDQWIFEALAPVIDDGEFQMSGDEYRWMWEIKGGEFREVTAELVYDHDGRAEPLIEKLVELMYPEHLNGNPITLSPEGFSGKVAEFEAVLWKIENLLRETGYGPQAGKNELDRLAEV